MNYPNPVSKGLIPSADDINRINAAGRANIIRQTPGCLTQRLPGGTLVRPRRTDFPWMPSRSVSRRYPFDITITETAGPVYTATFRAGTINSLLPDNYLTGVTVPATGTRYLVLSITVSSGAITGATFSADTVAPDAIAPYAGEPPTAFDILIGVVVDTVATKVGWNGNIQALPVEAFRLQKATPVAGQVPYDVYYTWSLSVL